MNIDLHMHTTKSDGELNPSILLDRVEEQQINIASITDHDKVQAYEEVSHFKGKLISGVELSTSYEGIRIELLAYGYDIDKIKDLEYINNEFDCNPEEVLEELKLNAIRDGFKIDKDLKLSNFEYGQQAIFENLRKYPENLNKINRLNDISNMTFYREICCDPNSTFYSKLENNYPKFETISIDLKDIGGKVFLAHPLMYHSSKKIVEGVVSYVDGYECGHTCHSPEGAKSLYEFSKKNNKLISGGSDFHGEIGCSDRKLGKYTLKHEIKRDILKWVDNLPSII